MTDNTTLTRARMKTPRAAAIAGILFSLLMFTSLVLIRLAVPGDPVEQGNWLTAQQRTVVTALNLVPFAGIAFLWFIGVVRDRLGEFEDRFFSTVFFGSGLLFMAMFFASAAVIGGMIIAYQSAPDALFASGAYTMGRAISFQIMNVYAIRMAAVFMISTCTIAVRTEIFPRWMALLGYALALVLLVSIGVTRWITLVFPAWTLVISIYILFDNYRGVPDSPEEQAAAEAG
jgi:hypothetical protein